MGESPLVPNFGQIDLDLGEVDAASETGPGSSARRQHARSEEVATRVVRGDALSEFIRSSTAPPPMLEPVSDRVAHRTPSVTPLPPQTVKATTRPPGATTRRPSARVEDLPAPPSQRGMNAPSESRIAPRDDRVARMRELYASGDAAAALEVASSIGSGTPPPLPEIPEAAIPIDVVEASLAVRAFGELAPLIVDDEGEPPSGVDPAAAQLSLTRRQSVPRLTPGKDVSTLPIDHRGGFLLAHVDGMQTLEEILDVCAMPASEALSIIDQLESLGVIEFD